MRILSVLLLLLLEQQVPPVAPPPVAAVRGRVTDAITAQPLIRATVQLRAARGDTMVLARDTSSDGTFAFENIPPGEYAIEASASGYITNLYGERRDEFTPAIHNFAAGQNPSVQIALTPGAVIYGRLVDDRGELVVGATVQAMQTRFRGGRREQIVVQSVTSNDLGEYRLFMLSPGEYRVRVTEGSFTRASIPWYFPGTADSAEAQAIDLRVGQTIGGVDLSSFPTRGRIVSGTLQGTEGIGATVILSSRGGDVELSKSVDPNAGTFEFRGIPPGSYTLAAKSTELEASLPIDVRNSDILNARLTLAPGHRIPTRIRIEGHGDGDDPELEKLYFTIRNEPPIPGLNTDLYSPFANGRITPELLAGEYRVELTRPDDIYVKSIRLGDLDVLQDGLRIPPVSEAQLEIIVGTNPGSIQGRAAGKGATVVLVPDVSRRSQHTLFKAAKPGASGEFTFRKVPPGDYKLFVWQVENGGPWLDPDYLRMYEDRGTPVRVDPGKLSVIEGMIPVL